jgi:hypothetical protein
MINSYKTFTKKRLSFFQEFKKDLLLVLKENKNKNEALNQYKAKFLIPTRTSLEKKLGPHCNFMKGLDSFLKHNRSMNLQEAFEFTLGTLISPEKKKLQLYLAKYEAILELQKYWSRKYLTHIAVKEKKADLYKRRKEKSKLFWKENGHLAFFQLSYALFEAGYLTNSKNDVKKLIPRLAQLFEIELPQNWSAYFLRQIASSMDSKKPEVFTTLENAFLQYSSRIQKTNIIKPLSKQTTQGSFKKEHFKNANMLTAI